MLAKLEDTEMQALAGPMPEVDIDLRTFVLLTEPMGEKRAFKYLDKSGFKPYVPMFNRLITSTRHTAFGSTRRVSEVPWPIFPGYLFMPLNWAWDIGPIDHCPGLRQSGSKFLQFDGHFVVASETDMAKIRHIEETISPPYGVGDEVRVVDGPFADFTAEIARLDDNKRIELLMDIFGQKTKFFASASQITSL